MNTHQTLFLKKRFGEARHKISLCFGRSFVHADLLEQLGKCLRREIACDIFVSKRGLEKTESDAFLLIHLLELRKLGASIYLSESTGRTRPVKYYVSKIMKSFTPLLKDMKVSRYFIQETKNLMTILTILPQWNLSIV